jgi:hypothetical protein
MSRKLRFWQFSLFRLFLVLSAAAVIVPIALPWLRKPAEETAPPKGPYDPTDLANYVPKGFRLPYEAVISPNEVPLLELAQPLKNGGELRLYSTKRELRDRTSGAIIPDAHRNGLSLQFIERRGGKPRQIWSFGKSDQKALLVGYSDPYAFVICDDVAPLLALVFIDEQALYFAEIDLNNVPSTQAPSRNWDVHSLTHFVLDRFGDANWEPRFAIRNLKRESDGWSMEVGIKGETLLLKRTGDRQWVEVPSAKSARTGTD